MPFGRNNGSISFLLHVLLYCFDCLLEFSSFVARFKVIVTSCGLVHKYVDVVCVGFRWSWKGFAPCCVGFGWKWKGFAPWLWSFEFLIIFLSICCRKETLQKLK